MFWSSQLHACCVCDTLQTSKKCFLFESKLKCSWEASPSMSIFLQKAYSYFIIHLAFLPLPSNQALLQEQMCRIKETPTSLNRNGIRLLKGDTNLQKRKASELCSVQIVSILIELYVSHTQKECNWGDQTMVKVTRKFLQWALICTAKHNCFRKIGYP